MYAECPIHLLLLLLLLLDSISLIISGKECKL
jgi:hypothetical protein